MVPVAALLVLAFVAAEATPTNHVHVDLWNEFKQTHGKTYANVNEELARFNIFIENQQKIDEHNKGFQAGLHTYKMKMNKFGDMTSQEFKSVMNGYKAGTKSPNVPLFKSSSNDLPASVDWRDKGYVTPVKDQGQCGSCWAFSATGSLEGQHFKKNGKLVSLSEQNLVDCSMKQGNAGCDGGWMDQAFQYIQVNKGLDTEASYPYQAKDGKCRFNATNVGATDTGFHDIIKYDENDLQTAIANVGPISVAIDASGIQFYTTGVFYDASCDPDFLDHGVLAVGYGTTSDGQKYYIVKNSWGLDWGDKGYLLMSRDRDNNCGIASAASYPVV
jgi:cathepsin L